LNIAGAQAFFRIGAADGANEVFGDYTDSNGLHHSFLIDLAAPVAPVITGTVHGQTTTAEAPVHPFSMVTIGDGNAIANETLPIALSGGGGTLAGAGTATNGVYTLTGTAADVTTALRAMSFTPDDSATDTSATTTSTTTFTLTDRSVAFAAPVSDSSTTVIDSDPAVTPASVMAANYTATHGQDIAATSL